MSEKVKSYSTETKEAESHSVISAAAKALYALTSLVNILFLSKHNRTKPKDAPQMTEKQLDDKIKGLHLSNAPQEKFKGHLMYEASFLKRMLSGEFDKASVNSFQTDRDKNLYQEFNRLSQTAKEEKFARLKQQLSGAAL